VPTTSPSIEVTTGHCSKPLDRQFGISGPTTRPLLLPKSETIAIGPSSLIAPSGELAI